MRYKYVLFDLDGTILDTNELILSSLEHALHTLAPGQYTRAEILPQMGGALIEMMEHFLPGRAEEGVRAYREFYRTKHAELISPFPHAKEVLERLHAAGCKIAVVTNKIRETAELGWRLCEFPNCHSAFLTVEDVDKPKPDPAPVLKAVQLLEANPAETVMVGDSPHDIAAGKAAGVATVGVKWSLRGEAELRGYEPDYLVDDLLELERIVLGK